MIVIPGSPPRVESPMTCRKKEERNIPAPVSAVSDKNTKQPVSGPVLGLKKSKNWYICPGFG
jgi:hypothetical protein